MMPKFLTIAGVAAAVLASASAASAANVVYDNGPLNGTIDAFTINFGFQVSDSFTLTSAATVTGVNFGVWSSSGDEITSVDWGIATEPATYTDTATATVTSGPTTVNGDGYNVGIDSFSLPNVPLAAGTYYLVLQNAVVGSGDPIYWDENNGPSTASEDELGNLANYDVPGTTGSESFQILGLSGVPEPGAWALMLVGFGVMGAALRARRGAAAARA